MHTTSFGHRLPKVVEHHRVNLETRHLDKLLDAQLDKECAKAVVTLPSATASPQPMNVVILSHILLYRPVEKALATVG
jgi:hypothetical protein